MVKTATSLAGVVVLAAVLFVLWNLWVTSCGRLACSGEPAWWASEAAADSCPPDVHTAASDQAWAYSIREELPSWRPADPATRRPADKTTGWYFADGLPTEAITSGEGSKTEPDPLWTDAVKLLAEARGIAQPPNPRAPHPAASHSETKAAVWMKQSDVTYAVAVINNTGGPCGQERPQLYSCTDAVSAILPVGSTMVVWWWSAEEGRMVSATYEGTAA